MLNAIDGNNGFGSYRNYFFNFHSRDRLAEDWLAVKGYFFLLFYFCFGILVILRFLQREINLNPKTPNVKKVRVKRQPIVTLEEVFSQNVVKFFHIKLKSFLFSVHIERKRR
jgi:hypothetical protein